MMQEPKHRKYGTPMSEWISQVPGELPRDAVGLWQILAAAEQGFDLQDVDKIDYIRRNVIALIDKGAVPVTGGKGTKFDWIAKHEYGRERDEIAAAVIAEWQSSADDDEARFAVWFALPSANVGNLIR